MARLMIGAALVIIAYLAVDELLYIVRPFLRRHGLRFLSQLRRADWTAYIPLPIALILALLMAAAPLVSLYIVMVGILIVLYLIKRSKMKQRVESDRQVAQLVMAFLSIYEIRPSIFSVLEAAREKVDEPLRGFVTSAVETFYITSSPKRAFDELRARMDNPYLNQFLYILERSETASRRAVLNALKGLIERLRRRERLRTETETSLAVVTGQTLVILVISLAMVFIIALVEPLRRAYTDSSGGQALFIILTAIAILTAYYIDRQVIALKERVL